MGTETCDDAAVYQLSEDRAIVCTTDFFTPVVDTPREFGRIAAANALSDLYAMGAKPLFALNLVGFPSRTLPLELLSDIMKGGADAAQEAQIPIIGGHSIDDPEPKYGLVAVGEVHPDHLWRNVGAKPGDVLVLTKPLGSGVLSTAIKRDEISATDLSIVIQLMSALNKSAAMALKKHGKSVHAVTDVTGYGLLGHLQEMIEGSRVGVDLFADKVPILEGAVKHAKNGVVPGGSKANLVSACDFYHFDDSIDQTTKLLLADAQTSGGLLAAIAPDSLDEVLASLREAGTLAHAVVGRVTESGHRVVK